MEAFWNSITEGQGTVLSGALTVIAAIVGVFLGGWLFSGKVRNLETALGETEKAIEKHLERITGQIVRLETSFNTIGNQLGALEEQFSATSESLGQLRGSVGDLQNTANQISESAQPEEEPLDRDQVREDWIQIRDILEQTAASPEIDGRTRAKYARIDRRSYSQLIDALDWDENLADTAKFREASEIWQQYKNGRRQIDQADATRLRQIRLELSDNI